MGPEPLLRCGKGAEGARRADRGAHAGSLPRFGPRVRVKPYSCLGCIEFLELGSLKIYSTSYTERRGDRVSGIEPPLRCAWASFYSSKGSPTGVNVEEGKNVKLVVVVTVHEQCMNSGLHLTPTVGDKGIECPSPSPQKHLSMR